MHAGEASHLLRFVQHLGVVPAELSWQYTSSLLWLLVPYVGWQYTSSAPPTLRPTSGSGTRRTDGASVLPSSVLMGLVPTELPVDGAWEE